ncbi:hypothetical protein EIP91_010258 [Steccherinum ochraceum]|uniref:Enoyl reductase (ER) domain-containing protein n=1 Tax=Steccherinum ochraceum TaxID=92696 RepID=A0A4V6N703_9APHY|nr:hypothetical protein EIP91_010258 [Steccherinum ochraceum]
MAPVKNGRHLFKEIASGFPEPGKTTAYDETQTIDLEKVPLKGGMLVKILYISIDPYLRFRMRDPKEEKNFPLFKIGEPIDSHAVGRILRSENTKYKAGDHVYGRLPQEQYTILAKDADVTVIQNEENIPWSLYVGVAGMPGQTAYVGWRHFAKSKKGDTVFVTTAAGPVGATVVQIAKAEGLRVIASAGSKEKVDFVKSLGADVVFNYKEEDTRKVLQREGPIDIYWDHVGGEILDAVLENTSLGATIIVRPSLTYSIPSNLTCRPVYRHSLIFERDITIYGFRVHVIMSPEDRDSFYKEIPKAIASGRMRYREQVTKGLENAPQVLLDVQLGKNEGKSVIEVARE